MEFMNFVLSNYALDQGNISYKKVCKWYFILFQAFQEDLNMKIIDSCYKISSQ